MVQYGSFEAPLWWDREIDRTGRPIRPDVRAAAHGIWNCAWRQAECLISDGSQAAELMENTAAEVSRYLDRGCVVVFSRKIDGLVMLAFQRALRRRMAKLERLKIVGGSEELSIRAVDGTHIHHDSKLWHRSLAGERLPAHERCRASASAEPRPSFAGTLWGLTGE